MGAGKGAGAAHTLFGPSDLPPQRSVGQGGCGGVRSGRLQLGSGELQTGHGD